MTADYNYTNIYSMKQVLLKNGQAIIEDVPAPIVSSKNILVKVMHSCISVGTESASLKMSSLPLYKRALKQPENVLKVIEMAKNQGIERTIDRVTGKLASGSPTGYSCAGQIIEIGSEVTGFSVGDIVGCAGAGIANHAEYVNVPVNLAVKVPSGLSTEEASTVTLGSIALQGVRRLNPTLGETIVVIGLGVLGQLTVQMLKANGCRVIGIDLSEDRVNEALSFGMDRGVTNDLDLISQTDLFTEAIGADGVIITASSNSNEIVSLSMRITRKKGRVVLVGDVGLNLKRSDFYQKELDFFISSSYGPGRYDPLYEEGGNDYPIAFVRWTENRNMFEYLRLLSEKKINIGSFFEKNIFEVEKVSEAYKALNNSEGIKPLMVLLKYQAIESNLKPKTVIQTKVIESSNKVKVGLAGAGSFALGMHLPNMQTLKSIFQVSGIMSRTGSNAVAVAKQYSAEIATTDYNELLNIDELNLIMVTTRHDLHGKMVFDALEKGKNVFVEKPLALNENELNKIEQYFIDNPKTNQLLITGFNRRYAPIIQEIKKRVKTRTYPLIINYTMNAGFIPQNHWVHTEEGGGRNIGEACHIYDLFNSLTESKVVSIEAKSINPSGKKFRKNENFIALLKYEDGSICSLTYTSMGSKKYGKEFMEVFMDGEIIRMSDFTEIDYFGIKERKKKYSKVDKGQFYLLKLTGEYMMGKIGSWPISLEDQISATRISFEVEKQLSDI